MARRRMLTVDVRTHRNHRLEICDTDHDGWMVRIYSPATEPSDVIVLRHHVPLGLPVLIQEAHFLINCRIDGRPNCRT